MYRFNPLGITLLLFLALGSGLIWGLRGAAWAVFFYSGATLASAWIKTPRG
jgi:hypothetical protein